MSNNLHAVLCCKNRDLVSNTKLQNAVWRDEGVMKLFQRYFSGLALLMLSALGCTAFAQQSVTLSGRLVDELTGRPVSTAIYTVGQDVRTRGVNSGGRFNILDVTPPEVSVKFSAQGYKAREPWLHLRACLFPRQQ